MPTKLHLSISFSNYRKSKIKTKILKEDRGKNTIPIEKQRITLSFSDLRRERSEIFKVSREKPTQPPRKKFDDFLQN